MATKLSVLGAVLASLVLIAGCGGGGGGTDTTPPPVVDDTRPTVKSVTPADGATGIAPTAAIVAVLSEPMVCTSGATKIAMKLNGATATPIDAAQVCTADKPDTFQFVHITNFPSGMLTLTLSGLRDLAGNSMVDYSWTVQIASPPATVSLDATPPTITVGQSTTLAWTTTNAANCVGSGGLSGSLAPAGGTLTVSPAVTTTYGIECRNADNISTGVVNKVVTVTAVTPPPVVTYPAAVVMFGPNWVYRVDPTVPGGIVPIANRSGHDFYSYAFRATALPNCQIQVSALDNYTFAPLQFFWDRKKEETTLDTTGTAPPRSDPSYISAVLPDPSFPNEAMSLTVGDEHYFMLDTDHQSMWYRKGAAPAVLLGTFPIGIKAIIAYPACTAQ